MLERIRRWSERRRRPKRKPRPVTFRFHDPCFGSSRETLALPAPVRRAAESLAGKRLTLVEGIAKLQAGIAPYGGFLEVPAGRRYVLWHMPTGRRGDAQLFHLVRFK